MALVSYWWECNFFLNEFAGGKISNLFKKILKYKIYPMILILESNLKEAEMYKNIG